MRPKGKSRSVRHVEYEYVTLAKKPTNPTIARIIIAIIVRATRRMSMTRLSRILRSRRRRPGSGDYGC
jgi:hypothetical protein